MEREKIRLISDSGLRPPRLRSLLGTILATAGLALQSPSSRAAESAGALYIKEYRVRGATLVPRIEIEEAVYPFLGPGRSAADVEGARAALEKIFRGRGFETVSVQVPPQEPSEGVVFLQVVEAPVGRLRVRGSRFHSLAAIKRSAPSMAEGRVPNFGEITRDIIALNQLSDRRVTPTLRAGVEPNTVDIDLTVADTLPLHGSLELNNRASAQTTKTRLSGAVSYLNLWQLGHAIGGSFQIAPERLRDARVFSGFYTARFPGWPGFTLSLQGTVQDSDVSTLGGAAVAGRGFTVGLRAGVPLPSGRNFYQSLSVGIDYKDFEQTIRLSGASLRTPIRYVPVSLNYGAVWSGQGWSTELNLNAVFAFRGVGDGEVAFETKRFGASSSFVYLRGEASHTRDVLGGWQIALRAQGQAASGPLLDNEEFSAGGLSTVRGYLESSVLGDNAFLLSSEIRTPNLANFLPGKWLKEARFYAFLEGGVLNVSDPLPEQQSRFYLASYGAGLRWRLASFASGSLDLGVPLIGQSSVKAHSLLLNFRLTGEF
ncbi:MAG: ShlB/FhaC/HecB family hemolysin secretion/activation protein [Verrucomicrobia bacterium]|nr:ShlB/FhaC/HecB family hemolysin secretion/activation protein [Verrucomicrobiota bacterium]